MTQKTFTGIIFTMLFILASYATIAAGHSATKQVAKNQKELKTSTSDHSEAGKKMPMSADSHSKLPHGKVHAPHMEELPHLHKFHKERVKKIRKHPGKYWFLSQVIIVLCHLSILVIGYLHATH